MLRTVLIINWVVEIFGLEFHLNCTETIIQPWTCEKQDLLCIRIHLCFVRLEFPRVPIKFLEVKTSFIRKTMHLQVKKKWMHQTKYIRALVRIISSRFVHVSHILATCWLLINFMIFRSESSSTSGQCNWLINWLIDW